MFLFTDSIANFYESCHESYVFRGRTTVDIDDGSSDSTSQTRGRDVCGSRQGQFRSLPTGHTVPVGPG